MPPKRLPTLDVHTPPRPADTLSWLTWTTLGALILAGLFIVSRYNFLLFHGLAELFSVAVAWSLFMLVWNTRQVNENHALIFIGIAFFFIGLVDLLHTLAYKGMGVFDDRWGANLPTQLWILGRYMQSAALLAFPLLLGRSVHLPAALAGWASATAIGLSTIFVWPVFPDCFVEGSGLTLFKVCSEYAVCVLLLIALTLLHHHRRKMDPTVGRLMAFSILTTIASELAFTLYVDVYGLSNLAGHFLKIIAFTLIYLALVRSGLTQPYSVLFNSLTESEARYRSFVSTNLMGIWWLQIDPPMPTDLPAEDQVTWLHRHATIEESNDRCAQMLGFDSAADINGMRVVDLMDGSEPSALDFWRTLVAEKGFLTNAELPIRSRSKKRLWFLLSTSSLLADGRMTRLWGSQVDITARKRREEVNAARLRLVAFAGSHTVQELLQKFLDEAEVLTDSAIGFFHFIEADQKTLSLQTWSTNTLKNMCTAEGAGQHYPIAKAGVWTDCVDAGRPVIHNDYPSLPHRKGMPEGHAPVSRELVVPVVRSDKMVAILGVGNKPTDYDEEDVAIVQALAEAAWETVVRRRAEEALIEARDDLEHQVDARTAELAATITELVTAGEELKRSNRELEQFAYVASHDLQEPLRAIVGFLQLLESRYQDQLDAKARHYIERSVIAGQRMQTLITDLLTLSRVSTRGAPFESVDLNAIFKTAFDNLEASIGRHHAVVNCAQLPTLLADPNQMLSLFQNLILNGLKYNQNPTPRIDIGCIENKNAYRFHIEDNGIGIAPEFHQRIFGLFQRLHTRSEYSGTGLGLALCKRIVERHGGRIWVDSQPGEGATFYFELMKTGVSDGG